MKDPMFSAKRNQVSLLFILVFVISGTASLAQAPQEVFARVSMMKVKASDQQVFEKFMSDNIKPVHALRRQQGQIFLWILFKVHNVGADDDYNYVGVAYHPSWATTDPPSFSELLKQVHSDSDAAAIETKWRQLGTLVRQHILYRVEAIEPNPPVPSRYVRLDYMRVRPGKNNSYLTLEKDAWLPVHQSLIDDGKCTGWGLWQLVLPGGIDAPYHYVTSQRYAEYEHVLGTDFDAAFKKTHPQKNTPDILEQTTESRDLIKSELWEVVDMLQ